MYALTSSLAASRARASSSTPSPRPARGYAVSQRVARVTSTSAASPDSLAHAIDIVGVHHVAVIVENLERSMEFYGDMLGLEINLERPADKLPYRGAWLMVGPEMIHLMELPNPDCAHEEFRPTHGGGDRHLCLGVRKIKPLLDVLDARGIKYTSSKSGRPAIFFRDPDANTLEVVEGLEWR